MNPNTVRDQLLARRRPWSGEIRVRFRAGFTNTYYPRTIESARAMVKYYSKDREVISVRVDGQPL